MGLFRKSTPGDGSALPRWRRWQFIWRGTFTIVWGGHRYDVDVNFFDLDERVYLYVDNAQTQWQRSPAKFAIGRGETIVAELSRYGMKRVDLVSGGARRQLRPRPGTAEAWRMNLHRTHRKRSRVIGALSWLILVVVLLLEIPQALETVADLTGWFSFTSPITLEGWVNTLLWLAGAAAGLERALRLKYHWLLD